MSESFVFLDVNIGTEPIGRIVIELFGDKAPKTCKNFQTLCSDGIEINKRRFGYKNNCFHRIIKTFMIQAGDIVFGSGGQNSTKSSEIGKGGCSIFAQEQEFETQDSLDGIQCYGDFADENLGEFSEPFMVAMANMGTENSNSSQFFITTQAASHLNNKHSIFGRVIHGKSVVRTVERCSVDSDGFPAESVFLKDCGVWNKSMPIPVFNTSNNPIGGDVYEEFPDDDLNFDKESSEKAFEAATIIKDSGSLLFKHNNYKDALFKYKKSLRYVNEFIPEIDVNKEFNGKFINLKAKLYLNISLVYFQLKSFEDSLTYSTYLLEMSESSPLDRAKALYRQGNCHFAKNRFDKALTAYASCKELNPKDSVVDKKIADTEKCLEQAKEKTRKSLAKFFG
ncbi:LAME_0E12156g1_1 [Lachancea meyersii CBS 8951]|uniref:peptidylprolyl isomerase n=1 Tax=Lachancea meyersii CBS 8951 TaxID=1266667 RepID=A0A1G4JLG5_9SACH|nr:LAME_0E12156g1_1 [Lachancea meyersii CBS 8951]